MKQYINILLVVIAIGLFSCSPRPDKPKKKAIVYYNYSNPVKHVDSSLSDTLSYKFIKTDSFVYTLYRKIDTLEFTINHKKTHHNFTFTKTQNNRNVSFPLFEYYTNTYSVGKEGFGVTVYRTYDYEILVFFSDDFGLLYLNEGGDRFSFIEYPNEDYYKKAKSIALNIFCDPYLKYKDSKKLSDSIAAEIESPIKDDALPPN